jgi:hypothetical protein
MKSGATVGVAGVLPGKGGIPKLYIAGEFYQLPVEHDGRKVFIQVEASLPDYPHLAAQRAWFSLIQDLNEPTGFHSEQESPPQQRGTLIGGAPDRNWQP